VVQEQLALHEEEWEVVEGPTKDVSADLVVKSLEGWVVVVVAVALPSEDSQALRKEQSISTQSDVLFSWKLSLP